MRLRRRSPLIAALRSRRRLEFVYRRRSRDEEKSRSASPPRLTFYRSNWNLAAWCHERKELRVFSVDRIAKPRCLTETGYDPPAEHVSAELDSSYGIFTGKADKVAVLRFNELAARWVAEEEWHPGVRSEPQSDGGVILRIPYKHETELVMDILRHGPNVEVLGPIALRHSVCDALTMAAAQYAEPKRSSRAIAQGWRACTAAVTAWITSSRSGRCALLHPMQRAELVAVRVSYVSEIDRADAAGAHARRILDRRSPVRHRDIVKLLRLFG